MWAAMTGPYRLDRALLRVSGAGAVAFLNNLLTQDVARLGDEAVLYAALLTPQGKVLSDMLLWGDSGAGEAAVVIDAPAARGADLLRRLNMYKLRAPVQIDDVSGRFLALWAPERFDGAQADPRLPPLGWRALSPLAPERSGAAASEPLYDAHRLALGVPDLARDAQPDEVFALEALLEELNGVDFQKGCFVGQENVSRMKRRATTRKKFCPIAFDGPAPEYGAAVLAGAAELGSVRTGMTGRAMALLRLDRAIGQTLAVGGRGVALDPPGWLILPGAGGAAGAPD